MRFVLNKREAYHLQYCGEKFATYILSYKASECVCIIKEPSPLVSSLFISSSYVCTVTMPPEF